MPKNTRQWAQRKLTMGVGNLDQCIAHLEEVYNVYHEHHPEISLQIFQLQTTLCEITKLIQRLRRSF